MKKILTSIAMIAGIGILVIGASNAFFSDTETSEGNMFVAGAIDLQIDSECTYNGETSDQCGTWGLIDLTSEKFFNFTDVKPGDYGENTISMHVNNNDAWACVTINPTLNDDMSSTEPELEAGDVENTASIFDGELAQNMEFKIWADTCRRLGSNYPVVIPPAFPGDNVYQEGCDTLLTEGTGPITPITWPLASPATPNVFNGEVGDPLIGSHDYFIGVEWSIPSEVDNIIQTDKYMADISFYVEQSRNNPDFSCDSLIPDQEPVSDYLNIGDDVTSEMGHSLVGWSDPWISGGWGGVYGGGSSDSSFRLLMGRGDDLACGTTGSEDATFTMNAGSGTATKLTLEHLDGQVDDSFDVYINGTVVGNYVGGSLGGEAWTTTEFSFTGVTGTVNVKLVATQQANAWCLDWGQVAFSNALLE